MRYEPLHHTVVAVDTVGSGYRDDQLLLRMRADLREMIDSVLGQQSLNGAEVDRHDLGDGTRLILPPTVTPRALLDPFVSNLAASLREHRKASAEKARLRLRVAAHMGLLHRDQSGWAGAPLVHCARLLDAAPVREVMTISPEIDLVLVVSSVFYDEVIRHGYGLDPEAYELIRIAEKETQCDAWVYVPGRRPPYLADSQRHANYATQSSVHRTPQSRDDIEVRSYDLTLRGVKAEFYNEFGDVLRFATEEIYRTGDGFYTGRGGHYAELLKAEDDALSHGVEVIRVQTSPRAMDQWARGLAGLVDKFPERLRVFADFTDRPVPSFGIIDPYGAHPVVVLLFVEPELAISGPRTRAEAALVIHNHRVLAANLARQFLVRVRSLVQMDSDDIRLLAATHRYFAYGPHMAERNMRYYVPDAVRLGKAILRGWRLILTAPGAELDGAAAHLERTDVSDDAVEGVVYELSSWAKARLLAIERGPYCELTVRVDLAGQRREAFAFLRLSRRDPGAAASQLTDLELMIEGAEENQYHALASEVRGLLTQ